MGIKLFSKPSMETHYIDKLILKEEAGAYLKYFPEEVAQLFRDKIAQSGQSFEKLYLTIGVQDSFDYEKNERNRIIVYEMAPSHADGTLDDESIFYATKSLYEKTQLSQKIFSIATVKKAGKAIASGVLRLVAKIIHYVNQGMHGGLAYIERSIRSFEDRLSSPRPLLRK